MTEYFIDFHPDALAEWDSLDGSIRRLFLKFFAKLVSNPYILGRSLYRDLEGCYKIKLRSNGYRIVYSVIDDIITIYVWAVGKRKNSIVYKIAAERIKESNTS